MNKFAGVFIAALGADGDERGGVMKKKDVTNAENLTIFFVPPIP